MFSSFVKQDSLLFFISHLTDQSLNPVSGKISMGKEASKSFGMNYHHLRNPCKTIFNLLDEHNITSCWYLCFRIKLEAEWWRGKTQTKHLPIGITSGANRMITRKAVRQMIVNSLPLWLMIIKYIYTHFDVCDVTEEEVQERAQRAAAAARRWREYSRRGVDKRPTFKLPDSASRGDN